MDVLHVCVASTYQGQDAYSLPGECGQVPQLPARATCALGKHGRARHCGREPPPHTWSHLDHHSTIPGV